MKKAKSKRAATILYNKIIKSDDYYEVGMRAIKEGKLNEVDFEKIKLPGMVGKYLDRFVESMKAANLNRIKRSAVLYKVIEASGMSVQQLMADIQKIKKELQPEEVMKEAGAIGGFDTNVDINQSYIHPDRKQNVSNQGVYLQGYSNNEARQIIDNELKKWVKLLRKVEHSVIKDWMKAAKGGAIDFFDIIRGLKTGDIRRAHPYEVDFLVKVLTRDRIVDRFRSYFKGKKGKTR